MPHGRGTPRYDGQLLCGVASYATIASKYVRTGSQESEGALQRWSHGTGGMSSIDKMAIKGIRSFDSEAGCM